MKIRTNVGAHAKIELDILAKTVPDAIVTPFAKEIISLAERFGSSGQSGGSAPFTTSAICDAIKSILSFDPICDITGHDDEWAGISSHSKSPCYQNKRCSAIFKDTKDGRAYYIDAISKKTQNGICWTGPLYLTREDAVKGNTGKHPELNIGCKHLVKSFPFKPKTFYIDCLEEEVAKDDWIMWVKDPKQLDKVWEYYDQMK